MEGEAASAAVAAVGGTEFHDWELLANSDSDVVQLPANSLGNSRDFGEIEADSGGMIRLDYFSLENEGRFSKAVVDDTTEDDDGSVESDNPSWVDPGTESRFVRGNSVELWPDSGSDRSDERKLSDFDGKAGGDFMGTMKTDVGYEGIDEIGKSQVSRAGEDKKLVMFWSDPLGEALVSDEVGKTSEGSESEDSVGLEEQRSLQEKNLSAVVEVEGKKIGGGGGEEEKRKVVWWKVPFEVLRYCVFRVSPVWTFSMAAAMMGIVILAKRLYKMKRRTRSLQLKVAVDDKKVSQVMSRTARLNEAFSVVRRVPIVKPLLPASGANPWPVMSLR